MLLFMVFVASAMNSCVSILFWRYEPQETTRTGHENNAIVGIIVQQSNKCNNCFNHWLFHNVSAYPIFDLFGLFFQPEQYFSLTTIQPE